MPIHRRGSSTTNKFAAILEIPQKDGNLNGTNGSSGVALGHNGE